jgi:hypothetical protein
MEHKGYAFDWRSFENELRPILIEGLETGGVQELLDFIENNRGQLTDPYAGITLKENWQLTLSNRDAHEYGDYALTKYYNVREEMGVGPVWIEISDRLPAEANMALLGKTLGPKHNFFDPGRMGSYFQQPEQVNTALDVLTRFDLPEIANFCHLLSKCVENNLGVYVTF